MEFKSFPDIKKLGNVIMSITQKIHGTNAHVMIYKKREYLETLDHSPDETEESEFATKYPGKSLVWEFSKDFSNNVELYSEYLDLMTGSRTRWIAPGDDNYGFAAHVYANKQAFIDLLGEGRHDGEWAGLGINSGEGLKEKVFVLFDWYRYVDKPLPPNTVVVPILYKGKVDFNQVQLAMDDLKTNGSKLCPGFMRPEGVVVQLQGQRYKVVFDEEEIAWTKPRDGGNAGLNSKPKEVFDASHLLQPIRLEKLLSRDERYLKDYPKSLPVIAKDYFAEDQITGTDAEKRGIRKSAGGQVFKFLQEFIELNHRFGLTSND